MTRCYFRPWNIGTGLCYLERGHAGEHKYAEEDFIPNPAIPPTIIPKPDPTLPGGQIPYQPAIFGELFQEEEDEK